MGRAGRLVGRTNRLTDMARMLVGRVVNSCAGLTDRNAELAGR